MLLPLNYDNIPNFANIMDRFKNVSYDENNEYSVPYTWGTVGIIYDNTAISIPEEEMDWSLLWDKEYKDQILMFDNPRDAFGIAEILLGYSINTENGKELKAAAEKLKEQKSIVQSYVMDEIYGKLETGEAAIGPYYAGDYLVMLDVNEDLKFFYPKEGTNIFIDSICIPKCVKNYEAAMLYINFLLEPDIALANAEYIGYASPHTAVVNNPEYCYYNNEILYPKKEDMPDVEYYHDLPESVRMHYENLWLDLKLY